VERHVYSPYFISKIKERCGIKPPTQNSTPSTSAPNPTTSVSLNLPQQHQTLPVEKQQELIQSLPARFRTVQQAHANRTNTEPLIKSLPALTLPQPENAVPLLSSYKQLLGVEIEERKRLARDLKALLETQDQLIVAAMAAQKVT
jgi:hypothetical protein